MKYIARFSILFVVSLVIGLVALATSPQAEAATFNHSHRQHHPNSTGQIHHYHGEHHNHDGCSKNGHIHHDHHKNQNVLVTPYDHEHCEMHHPPSSPDNDPPNTYLRTDFYHVQEGATIEQAFTTDDPHATFQCRTWGAENNNDWPRPLPAWGECNGRTPTDRYHHRYTPTRQYHQYFQVRAVDEWGNADPWYKEDYFHVDRPPGT